MRPAALAAGQLHERQRRNPIKLLRPGNVNCQGGISANVRVETTVDMSACWTTCYCNSSTLQSMPDQVSCFDCVSRTMFKVKCHPCPKTLLPAGHRVSSCSAVAMTCDVFERDHLLGCSCCGAAAACWCVLDECEAAELS